MILNFIGIETMGARGAIAPPPNNFLATPVEIVLASYINILVVLIIPL